MNRRLTSAALAAAAALTISLASPLAAQADESAGIAADSTPGSVAAVTPASGPTVSALAAANPLGAFSFRNGTISSGSATIAGNVSPAVAGDSFKANVRVNGADKGQVYLYSKGFYYTGAWGAGLVRLGPVSYYDSNYNLQTVQQYSNTFRVRQGVKWNYSPIQKSGSKITFKFRGFKTFTGTRWVKINAFKLQYKKGAKWKNLKTVRPNRAGNKVVKLSSKKKRAYRVYIPTTAKIQGAKSKATRI